MRHVGAIECGTDSRTLAQIFITGVRFTQTAWVSIRMPTVMLDEDFDLAARRAASRLRAGPVAKTARYDRRRNRIVIALSSGLEIAFHPEAAQELQQATPRQLGEIEISPSGLGVHFPRLDADLYLPALLQGLLGSRRWRAAELGSAGGRKTSEVKAAAARNNGRLGGRPRKSRNLAAV